MAPILNVRMRLSHVLNKIALSKVPLASNAIASSDGASEWRLIVDLSHVLHPLWTFAESMAIG